MGRVPIASSNANFQSHQVNNILSENYHLSTKSSSKAHFISPISLPAIANHPTSDFQGNAENKKIARVNKTSSLSNKNQVLTNKKITRSSNTSSLSKANTKNLLSLRQNNFFSKERHSSFKKLDAVIQEVETLSSEIDELLMRFKKPLNRPSSFFNDNNKLHIIPFKHISSKKNIFGSRNHSILSSLLSPVFAINKDLCNSPRTSTTLFLSPKEKHFKIINSLIKGEIILTEGFNTSLQHALFDRGKSSYKNIILIRILLNVSDNRLVYYTSSLSIRNKAILRKCYINSLVYYRKRELNLLVFITSVTNTTHPNISETFIHHNHFITHESYHLLYEIS